MVIFFELFPTPASFRAAMLMVYMVRGTSPVNVKLVEAFVVLTRLPLYVIT